VKEERRIQVLLAEDSAVTRQYLTRLLESDARIEVIGSVDNGQAALDFVTTRVPDVILMDIHMPQMDGFEATRRIMEYRPLPIVICTATSDPRDISTAFQALEVGATACIEKPPWSELEHLLPSARHLLDVVRQMAEVRVVRRRPAVKPMPLVEAQPAEIKLIGIGASTGGPPVLQTILSALPRNFPLPILVVQHISPGFLQGMASWLAQTTGMPVQIASDRLRPRAGHVYLAPDDFHLGLAPNGELQLVNAPPEHYLRPAVSFLFRSLAQACGPNAIGVLLTGMGRDGADALRLYAKAVH
jgi:two-component system, chemotaxis family, protein-glutamate methylesterase/glutaminase